MKALLTIDEVCAIAGVSKPTVYRKVKLGEFPAPTKACSNASPSKLYAKDTDDFQRGLSSTESGGKP
jgi:hypothetical protein